MTLCGVLKNILLVVASIFIWGTVITWLQFVGYGIATAGLIYYGVGYDGLQTFLNGSQQYAKKMWEGSPDMSTAPQPNKMRRILMIVLLTIIVFLIVAGVALRTSTGAAFLGDLTEKMPSIFR